MKFKKQKIILESKSWRGWKFRKHACIFILSHEPLLASYFVCGHTIIESQPLNEYQLVFFPLFFDEDNS
jgi:hypothetical protein